MLVNRAIRTFCAAKEQYARHFIIKICFGPDGYYESSQFRPEFVKSLIDLERQRKAIVLGGDSFPFGTTTLYFSCDEPATAQKFVTENVFVKKGFATATIEESERISTHKVGNVANFYQIKIDF